MRDGLGNIQTALVLGGDSDIAFETVRLLAYERLERVILAGRNEPRLLVRASELGSNPSLDVETVRFDALEFERHQHFVDSMFDDRDDIDLVLLAFGLLGDQLGDERDREASLKIVQTNFTGGVSVLIPVIDRMKRQGHGSIVVLSTVAVERPRRSNFIYGSSKAGLDWFAQGMQDTLSGSGVHLSIIRPGFARTKMTEHLDVPPLASQPSEVANAIVNAIASNAEIVWVPTRLRFAMSVIRHLPRAIFRRLNL